MAYDFTALKNPVLKRLFEAIFSIVSGHDHDGVNSKAVTTGTPAAGALSADAAGRAIVAVDYFNAATVLDKFATDSLDAAEILKLIKDGAFAADAATRALFGDGIWPLVKLAATARRRILTYAIEDLAAGADIANRVLMASPTDLDLTLVSCGIIPLGASAGVDDGNTAVIKIHDGTSTIVEKTYNTGTQPPAAGALGDLGVLDDTAKVLSAGEKLMLDVTQGATANLSGIILQIVYDVADAA